MERLVLIQGGPLSGSFSLHSLAEGSEIISEAEEIHEVKSLQKAGDKAYKHENLASALKFYDEALEIDENNVNVLQARAQVYIKLGNFLLALQDADRLVAVKPDLAESHYLRGVCLDHMGQGREALSSFLSAISHGPSSSQMSMLTSKVATLANHFCELPEKLLQQITEFDECTVLCEVGSCLYIAKHYELCIHVLGVAQTLAISQQGIAMKLLLTLGNAHSALKHAEQALRRYQECLSVAVAAHDPIYQTKALVNLASLFLEQDDTHQAIIHYERLLGLERELHGETLCAPLPEYWTIDMQCALHLNLSIAYKTIGNMDLALKHANTYVGLTSGNSKLKKPAEARAHHNAGMLNEILGKYPDALDHYKQFVKMSKAGGDDRAVATGYGCMGSAYAALKNVTMSLTYHDQHILTATKLGDNRLLAAAYEQKGDTLVTLQKLDEAVECFMEMLQSCPPSDLKTKTRCLCKLGGAYRAQKRYQYSLYYYEEAKFVAEDFNFADVSMLCEFNIALILQHSSQMYELDQARRYLERLIPLFESKIQLHHEEETFCPPQLHTQLAECYEGMQQVLTKLGDKEKSLLYSEAFKKKQLYKATDGITWDKHADCCNGSPADMWSADKLWHVLGEQGSTILFYHLMQESVLIWVLQPGQGIVRHYSSRSSKAYIQMGEHIRTLVALLKKDCDIKDLQIHGENRALPRKGDDLDRIRKRNASLSSSSGSTINEGFSLEDAQSKVEENLKEFDAKQQKPAARQLFDLLIAPVDDVLSKLDSDSSVIIVPDKELQDCPFTAIQDWSGKLLSARFHVTYVSSLCALHVVTKNELEHLKRLDSLQFERTQSRMGGLLRSSAVQGISNSGENSCHANEEDHVVNCENIDPKRTSNPRLLTSGALRKPSTPTPSKKAWSREGKFHSKANQSSVTSNKNAHIPKHAPSPGIPPATTSRLTHRQLGSPTSLEKTLGAQAMSTVTTRTSTDTDITTSHRRITEFSQVSSPERCIVIGNPSLPDVLSLHGRHWHPPGENNHSEKECHNVAALLDTTAIVGHLATKQAFLDVVQKASVLHIASLCCYESGVLVMSPNPVSQHQGVPHEPLYLVTGQELCETSLQASLVVLSGGWRLIQGSSSVPVKGSLLPDAFIAAGAQCVLWLLWAIPMPALLKFYHNFYTALHDGAYVSCAVAAGVKALQADNRYSSVFYWSPFMLSGRDVNLSLRELRHAMLDQTIDMAEEAVHVQRGTNYLNPPPAIPPITSRAEKLESLQTILCHLLLENNKQPLVIPALIDLLDEALKRLHTEENNKRSCQLPTEVAGSRVGLDLLKLLDFHFQARGAALSTPYVLFPHWDHDDLLVPVFDAVKAIMGIAGSSLCSQTVCELLPVSQVLLCHLVDMLAITKHAPEVQLKVTDVSIKPIWRNNPVKAALMAMGFKQIGLILHFNNITSNKRLLCACLELFISISIHKSTALVYKLDVTLLGGPQVSKLPGLSGAETVRLPTLTPLILPRNQLRMSTPWLSTVEQPQEMDEKMQLARSKSDLAAECMGQMTRAKTWHQATVGSQAKEIHEQHERPQTTPQKVKVIAGAGLSQNRVPIDKAHTLNIPETAQRRDYSHYLVRHRLDYVGLKYNSDVRKLYLPHVQS